MKKFMTAMAGLALVAALGAGQAVAQVCVPPPSDLVSWWPGDGNADDIAGTNNGIVSGATFSPGQVGDAFTFDGIDDFVTVLDNASLDPGTGDFTWDFWINTPPFCVDDSCPE